MEKIINFVKNNLVIVILIILVILDSCKSEKKSIKPIERFTNSNKVGFCSDGIGGKVYENVTREKCFTWKKKSSKFIPDFCPIKLKDDPWIVQPTEHYEELSIEEIIKMSK